MNLAPADHRHDLVLLFLRGWRKLVCLALVGSAGGIAYALLAPEWYDARLSVVPSQQSQQNAAMALASKFPALDTVSLDAQRIEAVLTSNSVADEVIEKFKLDERYGSEHREHTRGALWTHCSTGVDRRSNVVTLVCEDRDPKVAMAMTDYFGEVGNRVFGRVSGSSAREEERFLETQVTKARHDVDEASRKLREFQEQHKIVDLPEQSKAVISAMAQIKGELLSKQLELSYLSGFSSRTEANVVQLQQQIAVMESKLKQLEDTQRTSEPQPAKGSADFFPGAMNVPELRYEFEQLLREQKVQETVFTLLTQRYELAKVESARDTSTFQILDHPTLPTFRSRPKRRQVVAFGALAGIALAAAWIVLPAWWRRRNQVPLGE